jgi:hypothetical protein
MSNQDLREQLYNERKAGTFAEVQLPLERITTLHGFFFDLDPGLLRLGNLLFPPGNDPKRFFDLIRQVLDRHPLARDAEVRATGTGLHVIVRLDPPVQLGTAAAQDRWAAYVRAVQATLPTDPNAPGITGLTRAVGSANSKNGAVVEVLRAGKPVTPRAVEEFVDRLTRAPFREVASVLLGDTRVSPCPVCRGEGSRLDVLDRVGMCYGACGKLELAQLLDLVYAPLAQAAAAGTPPAGEVNQQAAATPTTPARKARAKGGKAAGRKARKSAAGRVKAD